MELFRDRPEVRTAVSPALAELPELPDQVSRLLESDPDSLRIGTRGSRMAVQQAARVARLLESDGVPARTQVIQTYGDMDVSTPISQFPTEGSVQRRDPCVPAQGRDRRGRSLPEGSPTDSRSGASPRRPLPA